MKINPLPGLSSLIITFILSASLDLAYSGENYNRDEYIKPPLTEKGPAEYNPDLNADYSPIQSIDNNIEPSSNLVIAPDPAKSAQYEANAYNRPIAGPYRQGFALTAKDPTDYKLRGDKNPLFEPDENDAQDARLAGTENK